MTDSLINATLAATGWSKQELARRLGVNKSTVQDWTQGRSSPRAGVYADLAGELRNHLAAVAEVLARVETKTPPGGEAEGREG